MNVKPIPTIISGTISVLIAYALYSFGKCEANLMLLAMGGFVCLFLSLAVCLGVRFETVRTSVNTATLGGVFFTILLISHIIFALILFRPVTYVLINGIVLLIMILIVYYVAKTKQ